MTRRLTKAAQDIRELTRNWKRVCAILLTIAAVVMSITWTVLFAVQITRATVHIGSLTIEPHRGIR